MASCKSLVSCDKSFVGDVAITVDFLVEANPSDTPLAMGVPAKSNLDSASEPSPDELVSCFSTSRNQVLKAYRSNNSRNKAASSDFACKSSKPGKWGDKSQSVFTVISSRALGNQVKDARKFSPTTPLIWSALAIKLSRSPNSANHLFAVLGPALGTPGTLSTVSPIIDK